MKNKLSFLKTYKQQNIALLLGTVLLCLVIYQITISRTVGLFFNYHQASAQIERAASASVELARYQQQLQELGPIADKSYNRETLLAEITGFCRENGLLISAFPEAQEFQENGQTIITNKIEVQGNYRAIVALVYMLEQENQLGTISSVHFQAFQERSRSKKRYLKGELILRNLKS